MNLTRRHLLFVVFSLVLAIASWSTLRGLFLYASDLEHKNASQVFLIPFVSAFLIFRNRDEIFRKVRSSPIPGAIVGALGLVIVLLGATWGPRLEEGDFLSLEIAGVLLLWFFGFLLLYGQASFRTALFPLLFLAFCIPVPGFIMNPLVDFLQRGSAEMSYVLLKLSGTPVYRQGFFFGLPNMTIEVAKECSGIRSFISMLILSILGGHLFLRTNWKRALLILVAVPVMIFKNAVRIATLSLLAVHVDPRILESSLHREGGIPFFLLALVLIYPVLTLLVRSERRVPDSRAVLREV